ncbi:transporter substrate-binding domain-containing protein [Nitratifractor sp.]|uniref:transporter substrate-binding domain-containing protein n=1 Tax=Nitratifractor sp. TaxID=2268144 RepID=UPI0025FBC5FD|nr:transporter substrate-binding domain-containing protein [Nitratifractor sp.]
MIKSTKIVSALLLGISLLWGAMKAPSESEGKESSLEHVVLQLNWDYRFEFAGFIAAKEKGFYRDAGLDVELRTFRPGMDVVREVTQGRADYGLYSSKLLKRFLAGEPVKLLASFFKKPSMVIVARKGIDKPEDLAGRKILSAFSRNDFILNFKEMFRQHDVNLSKIELSKEPYSMKPFIEGKVDAMIVYLPSQLYRLSSLGISYNIIDPGKYSDLSLQQELFTSQTVAEKYPDRTLAFRNASIKGWDYALQHPYEIIDIIRKKYAPDLTLEELSYEYRIVKRLIQPELYPIGSIDQKLLLLQIEHLLGKQKRAQAKELLKKYIFGGGVEMSPLILTKAERDFLKKHPVLKAHNESNWPPFNFTENGQAKGFSIDYMNLIAEKIGVKVRYISGYTWYEFLQMIDTDRLDIIDNIAITPERKKTIAFTDPFIDLQHAIYTNVNNQSYFSLAELNGKRVALVKGFFIQQYLAEHYPGIHQVLVPDQLQALKLLSFGKVDAVVGKQVVVDYLMRKYLLSNIIATSYVKDPGAVSHVALGVSKKDKILARILKKAQKTVTEEELQKLKHKWFGINPLLNSKELLTPAEQNYLTTHRLAKVCIEKDRAPIEFVEQGKAQGIAVEILSSLTRRLHLNLNFRPVADRNEALHKIQTRECDLLAAASRDQRSAKLLDFTSPYLEYEEVFIRHRPQTASDGGKPLILTGKRLVGKWGDPVLAKLKKAHPSLKILETDSYLDALKILQRDAADYAVMSEPVYNYLSQIHRMKDLEMAGVAPVKSSLSIGVRKDQVTLYHIINKILHAMPRETFYAISDKWTSERILKEIDYKSILGILAVALLVISLITLAYWRQRKLVRRINELNETLEERIEEALEKNREQELYILQQDRLAKMGEMIAMIAHQWRQPLNNLSILIQLLVSRYKKGILNDDAMAYFQNHAQKQVEQMSTTIDDFRNFYRPEKEATEFCINESIDNAIQMSKMAFTAQGIKIIFHSDGRYVYTGYPNELAHAILNILNNARDVLVEKGESLLEKHIVITLEEREEGLTLEICDNAGGIPEAIIDKIFDPYFSTKQDKNGTGLGLYMTKVMIADHMHSQITVSNREEGACFTITFLGEYHRESESEAE